MTDLSPAAATSGPERQIDEWRARMLARPGVAPEDVDELEDHLRGHLAALAALGLTPEEAFLVAIRRVGAQHAIAADLAREHSGRLWKQYVGADGERPGPNRASVLPMLGFAVLGGLAVKIPVGYAVRSESGSADTALFAAVLALAAVATAYLAWRRRPPVPGVVGAIALALGVFGLTQVLYPVTAPGHTRLLALLHLPLALGVLLGAVYLGRDWRDLDRRLDYVRFLGEVVIYYVLIALGGGVLMGLTVGVFSAVGLAPEPWIQEWVLPLGVGGAVVVAAWLVEAKKGVVENMAPVLSLVFTPLFTLLLLAFLGALLATGRMVDPDRDVLIVVDLVLVVVLGLVLFSVSARPAGAPPGWFDRLQFLLVVVALVIDVVVLVAMAGRIGEYGASPNKLAALGENLVLAGNLVGSAWLSFGFLRGRRPFAAVERWQCRYLPVVGVWAALVVLAFPPVFGFR